MKAHSSMEEVVYSNDEIVVWKSFACLAIEAEQKLGFPPTLKPSNAIVLLYPAEIAAIHAAVFPEQHEAVKASEKIETVERTCGNCRFGCFWGYENGNKEEGRCHTNPPSVVYVADAEGSPYPITERPVAWSYDPACRFWEAK